MPTQPTETGGWVNAGSAPSATKKTNGWLTGEKPAASIWNWFFKSASDWWAYLALRDGYEAVTDAITWTKDTAGLILATPTAARTFVLPTTGVKKGTTHKLKNLASTAGYNITLNSSGGDLVWLVCPKNECELVALVDTPTTAADWGLLNRGWPIHARVHKSADQVDTGEAGNGIPVSFNTVLNDPAALFNDAGDKLVFNLPGAWEVKARVSLEGLGDNAALRFRSSVYFNGAANVGGDVAETNVQLGVGGSAASIILSAELVCTNPGADYATVDFGYIDSVGANIGDVVESNSSYTVPKNTWLSARYLGPL